MGYLIWKSISKIKPLSTSTKTDNLDRSKQGNTSACKTNQGGAIPPKPREAAMSKDQYDLTANIQEVIHVLDTPAGNGWKNNKPDGDGEERESIHVYPVAGEGGLFNRTPIEAE